ncbi:ribosomal RNA small subunit methyltransferase A [Candidatus Saccharibacteria bacterium]|nr:ribosomal RNA small subunit methyltransferase A [Candidatus Saccharibacteria bacterium]
MSVPKKTLGQHWLTDEPTLEAICDSADLKPGDTVLEIGPGLGNLTKHLLAHVKKVIAVELDPSLAKNLPHHIYANSKDTPWNGELRVVQADILKFDLVKLPKGYKVVANIPYYLTSNLLRVLGESSNPPSAMTLLVQKEVAQRICTGPGQMSVLAVSVQLYYECTLGMEVPARLFTPPPKIDSQVVILKRRPKPLFTDLNKAKFFRIVKAGFSEKRKKLRSSLAGGLNISKEQADLLLKKAGIDPNLRPQELSLEDWYNIYQRVESRG